MKGTNQMKWRRRVIATSLIAVFIVTAGAPLVIAFEGPVTVQGMVKYANGTHVPAGWTVTVWNLDKVMVGEPWTTTTGDPGAAPRDYMLFGVADGTNTFSINISNPEGTYKAETNFTAGPFDTKTINLTVSAFDIDTEAPMTTANLTPAPNVNGWINTTPVNVTFTATDVGSNVSYTNYTDITGTWHTQVFSGNNPAESFSYTINTDGIFIVRFYSTDTNGTQNVEAEKNITVRIDTIAPSAPDAADMVVSMNPPGINDTIFGAAGAVEADSNVTVYNDAGCTSKIGSVTADADGRFSVIDIGNNQWATVYITATDAADNEGACTSMTNDIAGPTIVASSATNRTTVDDVVEVTFDEDVDMSTAEIIENYVLESPIGTGILLTNAVASLSSRTVTITLNSAIDGAYLTAGNTYTLYVSNVTDKHGNPIIANSQTSGIVTKEAIEVFDMNVTGTYPSIMGRHTGTIKLNESMTVHRIYTYPCAGTGGHSEYVRIYGAGVNRSGTWNGYQSGDYHYIEFYEPFTLNASVTYNYIIETGSYPQIYHDTQFTNDRGTINCSTFTDANGHTYNDWIPVIRLE